LYDGAFNVEFDTQGRILVPPALREYAGFENDVHIIGMDTNLEIWDSSLWNNENEQNTLESISAVMEELNF
jgi:MraZ protein